MSAVLLLLSAMVVLATIIAVIWDRFRHPAASSLALVGSALPWPIIGVLHGNIHLSTAVQVFCMFGSGPMFLVGFFLFGTGRQKAWGPAKICLAGAFAAFGFTFALIHILSKMP